jgi:hypothetical protein
LLIVLCLQGEGIERICLLSLLCIPLNASGDSLITSGESLIASGDSRNGDIGMLFRKICL